MSSENIKKNIEFGGWVVMEIILIFVTVICFHLFLKILMALNIVFYSFKMLR